MSMSIIADRAVFIHNIRALQRTPYATAEEVERIQYLIAPVLGDTRFFDYPGSRGGKHHYFRGGLAQHTFEVLSISLANAITHIEIGDKVDFVALAVAAVWHDWGKMDEYVIKCDPLPEPGHPFRCPDPPHFVSAYAGDIVLNTDLKTHHITRAAARIGRLVCARQLTEKILHLVEAHHGRREWGSPNAPKTLEAMILHHADMQSVMRDCGTNPSHR